jgi:hypothetical protein
MAAAYRKYVRNTSIFWGIRLVLEDLYGWKEPVEAQNWQRLDALIRGVPMTALGNGGSCAGPISSAIARSTRGEKAARTGTFFKDQLSLVLAAEIEYGQYTRNDALAVARAILYQTPYELLGMRPAEAQ